MEIKHVSHQRSRIVAVLAATQQTFCGAFCVGHAKNVCLVSNKPGSVQRDKMEQTGRGNYQGAAFSHVLQPLQNLRQARVIGVHKPYRRRRWIRFLEAAEHDRKHSCSTHRPRVVTAASKSVTNAAGLRVDHISIPSAPTAKC